MKSRPEGPHVIYKINADRPISDIVRSFSPQVRKTFMSIYRTRPKVKKGNSSAMLSCVSLKDDIDLIRKLAK